VNVLFRLLWRPTPLFAAETADSAASALTPTTVIYKDFLSGDVAEWLKAAVC
jgi:hypothetical protein